MVSTILKAGIPLAALTAPVWVWAADAPAPPPLAVKAQVGYVSSHGNTDAQTANAKFEIAYTVDTWKHDLQLAGLYGKSNQIVSVPVTGACGPSCSTRMQPAT